MYTVFWCEFIICCILGVRQTVRNRNNKVARTASAIQCPESRMEEQEDELQQEEEHQINTNMAVNIPEVSHCFIFIQYIG